MEMRGAGHSSGRCCSSPTLDTAAYGRVSPWWRAGPLGRPTLGRFDVELSGGGALLRLVAALDELRSRLAASPTGDQAILF